MILFWILWDVYLKFSTCSKLCFCNISSPDSIWKYIRSWKLHGFDIFPHNERLWVVQNKIVEIIGCNFCLFNFIKLNLLTQ